MDTIPSQVSASNPVEYIKDLKLQVSDIIWKVANALNISRAAMMKQYNKNIRFHDHKSGDKVWLKRRYYKTGENRKLSSRKSGPWTIIRKMPNGVNFKIENEKKERKIIHHDRLVPFRSQTKKDVISPSVSRSNCKNDNTSVNSDSENTSDESSDENVEEEEEVAERRYPLRERRQRAFEGTIPWDAIEHRL